MKLDVLPTADAEAWYAGGLKFTCSQCGNCCTGGPGFVWVSREEIVRLAEYLKITPEETVEKYCRKVAGRFSLNEHKNPQHGGYDCVFLKDQTNTVVRDGQTITHTLRGCSIYPVRPLQCRTWPFWRENLSSEKAWEHSAKRCHGMNTGEHFAPNRINALRDARDWPDRAPTSATRKPS